MFDAKRYLKEQFQSPQRVLAALRAYKMPEPKLDAVQKWFGRGRVPAEYFPLLLCIREMETGAPTALTEYLTGEQT